MSENITEAISKIWKDYCKEHGIKRNIKLMIIDIDGMVNMSVGDAMRHVAHEFLALLQQVDDDAIYVYPERHNYPKDPDEHEPYGNKPMKDRIEDLEKRIVDLEELVEKLREHISSVIQITDPDFADHFE